MLCSTSSSEPEMISASEVQDCLYEACNAGDASRVAQLFTHQALDNGDATDALRDADLDDLALIRVLLQNGADSSVVSMRDVPISRRSTELLELLAEYNYDFKSEGHLILQDFAHDQATIDWLLDRGVDINRTDSQRLDSGFSLAPGESDNSLYLLNNVSADGNIILFDHLVSRGADPSLCTALHSASRCANPKTSKAMLCHLLDKYNMDIDRDNDDFCDFFGDSHDTGSPLCGAITHRNLPVVEELLKRGARVSHPNWSAVPYAVSSKGFLPALNPLLRAGANPTKALEVSAVSMNFEAAKACLEWEADTAPALREVLAMEERRIGRLARNAAYFEQHPESDYTKSERELETERAAERNSKAMVELLRNAMKTNDSTGAVKSL